jgi:hypothetical protein
VHINVAILVCLPPPLTNKQPEMTSGHQLKGSGQEASRALYFMGFHQRQMQKKNKKKRLAGSLKCSVAQQPAKEHQGL